ncbi:MAG: hypothetical protein LBP34_08075 [Flavobacteriaceae bacterium]|nr:hypothetical protein [Flavobacteriaceae bacterium]
MMTNIEKIIEDLIKRQNICFIASIDDGEYFTRKVLFSYPHKVTDSDYCALKFATESGIYYSHFNSDNFNSK